MTIRISKVIAELLHKFTDMTVEGPLIPFGERLRLTLSGFPHKRGVSFDSFLRCLPTQRNSPGDWQGVAPSIAGGAQYSLRFHRDLSPKWAEVLQNRWLINISACD